MSSYVVGIWGFKASLLLSYLRFMPRGVYHIVTITIGVLITLGHIAFICVFLFMCTPVHMSHYRIELGRADIV